MLANQRGGQGVVTGMVLLGSRKVGDGVTVLAAHNAAFVHSDVFANHTTTRFSLGWVFTVGHVDVECLFDELIVYAFPGTNAKACQIQLLSATRDLHLVFACNLDHRGNQVIQHLVFLE